MVALDLNQLEALAAVVDDGTFEAAAGTLHVTPSAVSQRIKALETSVGRVLVTRAKPVRPTPSGETLLRAARQILAVADEAARQLGADDQGPVVLPVAVNADSLATWFLPAVAPATSGVLLDLRQDDEERTADLLRRGEVMAAVTASADAVPGCSVERLGRMRYRPMAEPGFAARCFPDGPTEAALAVAPMLVFDREDRLQDLYLQQRTQRPLDPPRHCVPGLGAFTTGLHLGLGWGLVPELQPRAGDGLVDLDPNGPVDRWLYWQQWRLRSAALDAVAAALRAAAATVLR